ncbi:MAG: hypothetical protein ACYC9S_08440 [Leptospirales bacterium]
MIRTRTSSGSRHSRWSQARKRARLKPEPKNVEREQAIIRLVVVLIITLYVVVFPVLGQNHPSSPKIPTLELLIPLIAYSIALFLSILMNPAKNPVRRVVGISGDLTFIALLMIVYGKMAIPMGIMTLWVIMGNGFRYGKRYLWLATAVASLEFVAVFFMTPFWQHHRTLFYSQLAGIIVLPR